MKKIYLFLFFITIVIIGSAQQKKRTVFDDVNFIVEPIRSINTIGSDISPFFVDGKLYFSGIPEEYFNKESRERNVRLGERNYRNVGRGKSSDS